jgi:hypothetical protein
MESWRRFSIITYQKDLFLTFFSFFSSSFSLFPLEKSEKKVEKENGEVSYLRWWGKRGKKTEGAEKLIFNWRVCLFTWWVSEGPFFIDVLRTWNGKLLLTYRDLHVGGWVTCTTSTVLATKETWRNRRWWSWWPHYQLTVRGLCVRENWKLLARPQDGVRYKVRQTRRPCLYDFFWCCCFTHEARQKGRETRGRPR